MNSIFGLNRLEYKQGSSNQHIHYHRSDQNKCSNIEYIMECKFIRLSSIVIYYYD